VDAEAAKVTGKFGRFERLTALLVRVVVDTGCRPGELCVARWDHYHKDSRGIILPPYEIIDGKKVKMHKTASTGKPRFIMPSHETADRIEWEMTQSDRHPTHLFCHRIGSRAKERDGAPHGIPWNGNALCKRIRRIRRAAYEAGILEFDEGIGRLHLYRLRHTAITNSINGGGSAADTARLSGNSIKTIEKVYLSTNAEHLRGVADRLRAGTEKK
jgi:integrase